MLLWLPLSRLVKVGSWAVYGDLFATEREVAFEPAEVSLSDEPGRWPLAALSLSGEVEELAERGRVRRRGGSVVVFIVVVL